ncbi:GNAT family N-acetyltransferase [Pseudooctadecabacter jejudonensis]|uniref:Acetyltransferase (GNAT) family protein n=1 Tax=Pseudooctadecabacter jejudonensis TaxID=1391910 RepID=A0A1Y5TGN4_9RHOB|nr:N-acetyltransferase [Pseudooctadecabacter jejudonensis]SLN59987.1 Acetyltransferase (GNAT) family protein [Pseudooctadecabacter jejudonensis]
MKYKIRQEKEGDAAAIRDVVAQAFKGKSFEDPDDPVIVERLRDDGSLVLSLVAEAGGEVIGQVALSPAKIGDSPYLCLGPIAVLPGHQGKGIGSDLMGHALGVARVYGRDGVVLMGDPKYYSRFGFKRVAAITYEGEGADYIQVLPFGADPSGPLSLHPLLTP